VDPQNAFAPPANPFEQTAPANQQNAFQPPNHSFHQPAAKQPVTFNQFPPVPPSNSFGQNTSNGYSQNNQTETYYQAETDQSNYNFQNNQASIAPSKYNNPAGGYHPAQNFNNPLPPSANVSGVRSGA